MRNITVEYLDLLGKIIVERKKQDSGIPPQNRQAENYENDLTASIRLLEKGYDVKSVMSVIRDKSPMTKLLPDVRAMVLYTGKVMENVNDVWTMRAERSLLEAEGSYPSTSHCSTKINISDSRGLPSWHGHDFERRIPFISRGAGYSAFCDESGCG